MWGGVHAESCWLELFGRFRILTKISWGTQGQGADLCVCGPRFLSAHHIYLYAEVCMIGVLMVTIARGGVRSCMLPPHPLPRQIACRLPKYELKGSVSRDFSGPFLACMDRSRFV